MLCVRPGVFEVRASPFLSSSEFISEDFPTFDRPRNATSGNPSVVQCCLSYALLTNSAVKIFMSNDYTEEQEWVNLSQHLLLSAGANWSTLTRSSTGL